MDLIGRNLVLVAKRKSDGGVKVCRMHDLLRDLCMLKGKEQKFLQLITSNDEPYSSFDESVYGDDFDYLVPSTLVTYEGHRISVCVKRKHFVLSRPSGPNVRSLLVSAIPDMYPRRPYDVSFISVNLKLLKVLDVECINMGYSFANGIESLVHLRYLAVAGDIDYIPSSIANLWNLETLIVKGLKGKVVLPDTIWCMEKLRHVHVNNQAILTLQDDEIENFLGNITSLSSPSLSYGEVTEKIVRRLPNLRKLKCIFLESQHSSTKSNQFPRLKLLNQLESLNVVYYGRALNTGEFDFPLSLKKLTLSNFRLPWAHISPIGSLPNLEVLKLVSRAFEGTMWDMSEGEFLALKFLQLDTLSIVQWNASSDHLPKLQHLVLRDCDKLEEVPIGFVDIPTLQIIEVRQCRHSVEKSVRRIQEEQLELGIESLKILPN